MPDPKFEKAVKQQMEELKFSPSPAVWSQVEQALDKDKKRRPLIWFFLSGGLLLAVGSYFLISPRAGQTHSNLSSVSRQTINAETRPIEKAASQSGSEIKERNNPSGLPRASEKVPLSAALSSNPSGRTGNGTGTFHHNMLRPGNNAAYHSTGSKQDFARGKQMTNNSGDGSGQQAGQENAAVEVNGNGAVETAKQPTATSTPAQSPLQPVDKSKISQKEIRKDSTAVKPKVTPDKKPTKSRWQLGFTLSPGVSAVQRNLFHSASVQDPPAVIYSYSASYPYGGTPAVAPSTIQPGFSFSAGFSLRKSFSEQIALVLGLNYHYYSATIKTGRQVYNAILINPSGSPLQLTSPSYYSSGVENNYTDHYHFLELPVTAEYTLGHPNKRPVRVEGGLIFSRYLGGNTLEYNKSTGIYYIDNAGISKTQVSANLGLLFGFAAGKNIFQIGPQLQYGLTNLLQHNPGSEQHLFFGGVKMSFRRK